MRTSAHGSIATVLLLIPILAIPMLAVFGVPNFVPVVESPVANDRRRSQDFDDAPAFSPAPAWDEAEFPATVAEPGRDTAWMDTDSAADRPTRVPFGGAEDSRGEIRQAAVWDSASPRATDVGSAVDLGASQTTGFSNQSSGFSNTGASARSTTPSQPAAPPQQAQGAYRRPPGEAGAVGTGSPTMHPSGMNTLTWKSAVARLNELEIRNFRLEPGQQPGQFLFICSYTPQHSPRLSYRFEAEADEPLRAVEKVLDQIDNWTAAR